jgi:MFS family permease
VLTAAATAQAAVSFVSFGLPSIGPQLRSEYGLGLTGLGAVLAASLFGAGFALLAAGVAVDRFGARISTLAGTVPATAGLAVAAASTSVTVLIPALVVFGVGSSVVPIAGAGALFRAYPATSRAWALGVRQMAVPLGGTVAAIAMPLLAHAGGVRAALGTGAALVAVTGTAFALVTEDTRAGGPRPAGAFRSILRAPGMQRLLVVAALYIVVLQAVLSYTVPAVREAGLSLFVASATYFALNVTAMAARLVWGKIADRQQGERRTRTLVEVGVVASAGALLFTFALHGGPVAVVISAIVFGFGALGWNALVYVSAGERADPDLAARSVALAATVVFLLGAACTPLMGTIADRVGWDAFWATTAAIALLGAAVAASLPKALAR